MIWFFTFTTVGISVFTFLLAMQRLARVPFLKILGGTAILGITGFLAFKVHDRLPVRIS
ncbi:MAG: hypothetical protein Kow0029_02500 [Candidatus Rifleibacteriota bacterium]